MRPTYLNFSTLMNLLYTNPFLKNKFITESEIKKENEMSEASVLLFLALFQFLSYTVINGRTVTVK